MKYDVISHIELPAALLANWQNTVNLLAETVHVPAALIMRVHASEIEVFISSQSPGNLYEQGERANLDTGLYCETVMDTRRELLVPNAMSDPDWDRNPDIELGMISYCGLPITWPNGEIFGTICVLDIKENSYSELYRKLLGQFRDSVQSGLAVVHDNFKLKQTQEMLKKTNEELDRRITERTAKLEREITGRRLADAIILESEKKFRALFHQLPIGIVLEDYSAPKELINGLKKTGVSDFQQHFHKHPDDLKKAIQSIRILDANDTLCTMFGTASFDEYVEYEDRLANWEDPNWLDFYIGKLASLAAGKPIFAGEVRDVLPDGSAIELRCITRLIENDEDDWSMVLTTHEDISTRKKDEKILLRTKEEAEYASRAKSDFLANMSHELRTPLNSIIGFSQMLKDQTFGPVGSQNNRDYIENINQSGLLLLAIISDILDLSKIEAGEADVSKDTIDLSTTIEECVTMVMDRASKAGLSLSTNSDGPGPWLQGDKVKVKQVLLNLLTNAIKFTLPNGTISIDACLKENQAIVIKIVDTGIGIAQEDIPLVTNPFEQIGDAMMCHKEGTGLGLALSKRMVELHEGTLGIDSEVGKGTTITICFPPERTILRS